MSVKVPEVDEVVTGSNEDEFDEIGCEWLSALGIEGGEDDSVYEDDESAMINDDEDEVDATDDELKNVVDGEVGSNKIVTERNLTTTIEEYLENLNKSS